GTLGEVNEKGVDYYNSLIQEIIDNDVGAIDIICMRAGLEPYVTLFHWDFPQVLADQFRRVYLSPIIKGDYPDVMRELVGERLPNFTDEQTQEMMPGVRHGLTYIPKV
ncbi:hypothetical protein RJ639_024279, partial [Escallonia herrerae]